MTIQQAAWQKRPDIEAVEYEMGHPYSLANALGEGQNKSIKPKSFPVWQLLIIAIVVAIFIIF